MGNIIITDKRETGGNITTVSGKIDDRYFVCDNTGDGIVLDKSYNIDWTFEEFQNHCVRELTQIESAEILALCEC